MSDVAVDANVVVAFLDAGDALHERARTLLDRLQAEGHVLVLPDFVASEAVSALSRRSFERKSSPPVLASAIGWVRRCVRGGMVRQFTLDAEGFLDVLDLVEASRGELNFNDARLVVHQRAGAYESLATFDADFEGVAGMKVER